MDETFKKVVQHIFANWTALNLAIEHSDNRINSKEVMLEFVNYIVNYCLHTSNIEIYGIQEALDDIMDEEFDTVCEDGSTKEIALTLYHFVDLLKQENMIKFEEEYQKLPINTASSSQNRSPQCEHGKNTCDESMNSNIDNCPDIPMEEDSEWTVVKSKRKQ